MAEIIHYKRIGRFTGQCEFEFCFFFNFVRKVQLCHCAVLKFIQLTTWNLFTAIHQDLKRFCGQLVFTFIEK